MPDRSRFPPPRPAPSFTFPRIVKFECAGGLQLWTLHHGSVPVVTLILLVRRGAADDPPGKEGLAAITLDMLDEGCAGLSAIEFHEALARIGAQLDSDIGSDATLITVTVLSRFLPDAVSLLAGMVARPALAEPDFLRVRQLRLHRLMQLKDMPGSVADRVFVKLIYGDHPYGHTPLGNERSLATISLEDVREFRRQAISPRDATLIAVGDCGHADLERLVSRLFSDWEGGGLGAVIPGPVPDPPPLNVIPRGGAPQSELRIGHIAVARSTPDYHALVATNMVLGGQFVSRVNLKLREERGFTYGARTSFDFRRHAGPFVLQTSVQTGATGQAIEDCLHEIAAIRGPRAVTTEELAVAIAAATRGYARNFETAEQIARATAQLALYDLPDNYFAEFVPQMERVTPADVTRVAAERLDPSRLTTLIVGDADAIRSALAAANLGDPAILDLESF